MTTPRPPTTAMTGDRRPIAARHLVTFQRIAAWLAGAGVSANAVSVMGLLLGVGAGACFLLTSHSPGWARWWWLGGACLVQGRLLANMLDGMVAQAAGSASRVGELYNEVPDRLSDSAVLIGVGYAAGGGPALGYVAALLAVLTAYVRALGRGAGRPQDFRGPMAKQQRMFLVTLLGFWMAAVPTGWAAWRLDPQGLSMGVPAMVLAVVALGCVVTCWRRLATLAASLRSEA